MIKENFWYIFLIALPFVFSNVIIIYFHIKFIRKTKIKQQMFFYMQQAVNKQMNPHFIFNSLNAIQYFSFKNDIQSLNKYISKFSQLIRNVLDSSQYDFVLFNDVLINLKNYLELETIRFNDKFNYNIRVDDNIDTFKVKMPSLLLQPFVENSLRHGIMMKESEKPGNIDVDFKLNDNTIIITIKDDGIGRNIVDKKRSEEISGTGVVYKRLDLVNSLYNIDIKVDYFDLKDESNNPIGTKVEISLPVLA